MPGSMDYVRDFFINLRQPGMPPGEWVSKLVRNRLRAGIIKPGGCCGHPGEPGC